MSTHTGGARPYISVVVAARNDGHGGNMLERTQAFLDAWLGQSKRHNLPSEIIVVDWNPPEDRPRLREALRWPASGGPCEVRFVGVPAEVHRQFKNAKDIVLHQMIAKNVGIRRARGEFVLATNPGIVLSSELMRLLAERRLEQRTIYRIDRHDVSSDIPGGATADQLLAFCESHVLRVFTAEGAFPLDPDGLRALEEQDIVGGDAGIRFGAGWYPVEGGGVRAFRWMAKEAEIVIHRPAGAGPRLIMDVETGPSAGTGRLVLEVLDPRGSLLTSADVCGRCQLSLHIPHQVSMAAFRFRIQGGGVPLQRDLRILDLRFFGLQWQGGTPSTESSDAPVADSTGETNIQVRSIDPREIQLALNAGAGSSLETLEVNLTDSEGNALFRLAADRIRLSQTSAYLLTLNLGFKFSGAGSLEAPKVAEEQDPAWLLEVWESRPGEDWESSFVSPSPFAPQMRNAAYLHTTRCGDFTLLSRDDWFALRGYPEFPIWPAHLGALLCYAAHHAGIREVTLCEPMRIFRIEDASGDSWTRAGEKQRTARMEAKGVNALQQAEVVRWIDRMRRFNAPAIFSQCNWGLADVELPETT
jgi:hypothetical protein